MAFDETEQSIQDSSPVECYKFVGTFKTYRYTSSDIVENVAGEDYTPLAVTRSQIKSGTHEDSDTSLDLQFPCDAAVIVDYAFAQVPPRLDLTVFRQQPGGDFATIWSGIIRGFDIVGRLAKVRVPSIFSFALEGEMPAPRYQTPCNHLLYSTRCGASRAANTFLSTIQSVNGSQISLTSIPTSANDLRAGEIVNQRNGERRLVLTNAGAAVSIGYPFADLLPGDPVELVRGCDHRGRNGDCLNKFDNYVNFGGFEDIPADNPFSGALV